MLKAFQMNDEVGSAYVENMNVHQGLDSEMTGTFEVEAVPAVSNNSLYGAVTYASADDVAVDIVVDAVGFGRNLRVLSTNAGDITFYGFDWLNQPVAETITAIVGTVEGAKAFKRVTRIVSTSVDGNVSFGPGDEMGLPFCGIEVIREVVDGALGTDGTLTNPVTATPTATTGDPRGTYSPNFTPDGVKSVQVTLAYSNGLTGGLYGQQHYAG